MKIPKFAFLKQPYEKFNPLSNQVDWLLYWDKKQRAVFAIYKIAAPLQIFDQMINAQRLAGFTGEIHEARAAHGGFAYMAMLADGELTNPKSVCKAAVSWYIAATLTPTI